MRPIQIPKEIYNIFYSSYNLNDKITLIKKKYQFLRKEGIPTVSIVIPAYNEEKNILQTLHSLVETHSTKVVEIIVVNNNSTDLTEKLVVASGISCIIEKKKGITAARNAGLIAANGDYILNADADTVYPTNWIDEMIDPLQNKNNISVTYGRFSFIPTGTTSRYLYFFYEHGADIIRLINRLFREEALNVYGFNSGYRKQEGLIVNGYNHPPGANEDGYLALKLREKGFGKIYYVKSIRALVWTTDRRIQIEGGFKKGLILRTRKFLFPARHTGIRSDL